MVWVCGCMWVGGRGCTGWTHEGWQAGRGLGRTAASCQHSTQMLTGGSPCVGGVCAPLATYLPHAAQRGPLPAAALPSVLGCPPAPPPLRAPTMPLPGSSTKTCPGSTTATALKSPGCSLPCACPRPQQSRLRRRLQTRRTPRSHLRGTQRVRVRGTRACERGGEGASQSEPSIHLYLGTFKSIKCCRRQC